MEHKEMILVTNWERVEADDFYLSDDWKSESKERIKAAQKLQAEKNLYVAYIVPAVSYAIYTQMDAQQVFINNDMDVVLDCESVVIENKHDKRIEYNY